MQEIKNRWSALAVVLTVLIICSELISGPRGPILTYDIFGHYTYLPLTFENHNLILTDLDYLNKVNEQYDVTPDFYQLVETEDGHFYTKYTCGWAIMELPFYLIAEAWAQLAEYPADGFSYPYQYMIHLGALFYSMIGLFVVRRVLLYFFNDRMAAGLILALVFGTNLYRMYYGSTTQSHHFAFFLVACMVWQTIRFYEKPTTRRAIIYGFLWGMLTLVRPPDFLIGLMLPLWKVRKFGDMITQFSWFWSKTRFLRVILVSLIITVLPQMIYWFVSTGSPVINSYANNYGEGFDWLDPYFFEYLFSFRKGWLIYSPLMLFAFVGAYRMIRSGAEGARSLSGVSWIFLYAVSNWTCWWYGEGFGQRAMMDIYPILIVLIGFALFKLKRKIYELGAWLLITFFTAFSLFQTWQYGQFIIHPDRMTMPYYFSVFGQVTKPTKEQNELLAFNRNLIHSQGLEKNLPKYHLTTTLNIPIDVELSETNKYAPETFLPVSEYIQKSHVWVRVYWIAGCTPHELNNVVFYISMVHGEDRYGWEGTPGDRGVLTKNNCMELNFEYLTPNIRSKSDRILVGAMHQGNEACYLRSLRVEIFEPLIDYH